MFATSVQKFAINAEGMAFMSKYFSDPEGFTQFGQYIGLDDSEITRRLKSLAKSYMPFRVSKYYADLIRGADERDRLALLNIVSPPDREGHFTGRFDPYGNINYAQDTKAFLQHKYPPTLLVHMTDYCASNCQFCYKVNEIRVTHASNTALSRKVNMALDYLAEHPEVDNILFTGGDPGALLPALLKECIEPLIHHPSIRVLRFATKSVVFEPHLLADPDLLAFFSEVSTLPGKQITVIAQINHPAEFTKEVGATLRGLRNADVQVRGQPTLIRGVNDDAETLTRLMRSFIDHRISPYYYTIFMPVRGVEQYAIPIHEGLDAFKAAQSRVSGLEKKGVLLVSHDFGKIEVVDIVGQHFGDRTILLRWHEVVPDSLIPDAVKARIPHRAGDAFMLRYPNTSAHSFDELLKYNGMPHFDADGRLVPGVMLFPVPSPIKQAV
jgi:lysine 2,3-aminomutase